MTVAVFPGSFNPPTVAHLAVVQAALDHLGVQRVDLAVSRRTLAKEHVTHPPWEQRLAALERVVRDRRPHVGLVVTEHQLLVDIAQGYDVLVLGADKYHQIHEPHWYPDRTQHQVALARLPRLAVAPRPPWQAPTELLLPVDSAMGSVSSTRVRAGQVELIAPELLDPDR